MLKRKYYKKMPLKVKLRYHIFNLVGNIPKKPIIALKRFAYFVEVAYQFKKSRVPHLGYKNTDFYNHLIYELGYGVKAFDFLEFGVSKGGSFRYWVSQSKNSGCRFFGFDTFEGIPDDWGSVKKGAYTAHGKVPEIHDDRVHFEVGLFDQTLSGFLAKHKLQNQKVIHLDADLYSSTLYVLIELRPYLTAGTLIIFDEYFSVTKADHEFRAFIDFLEIYPIKYKYIAKASNQLAIEITETIN